MLCISSYLFFKKSFLGCLVVTNMFKPQVALNNSVFQNSIRYLRNVCFTSRSTANLLTVIADRIAKVTSGATQATVLDISKASHRLLQLVFFTILCYMAL